MSVRSRRQDIVGGNLPDEGAQTLVSEQASELREDHAGSAGYLEFRGIKLARCVPEYPATPEDYCAALEAAALKPVTIELDSLVNEMAVFDPNKGGHSE